MPKFDLHMHSNRSDGGDEPERVVEIARENDLCLMALTDHDTMAGIPEAMATGRKLGLPVLPSLEMDTEWPSEVHILGLDVNPLHPGLLDALHQAGERRNERNMVIIEKLKQVGCDIAPYMRETLGSVTKLHIGLALVEGGFAQNVSDAFNRYLKKGMPGYYTVTRFTPEEVIALILQAGGVPVWAHPYHAKGDFNGLLAYLIGAGLMGLEAYHPSATEGQSSILVSLAAQHHLLVTCGSDSHGLNRPNVTIGCTWRDSTELNESYGYFAHRANRRD